MLTGKKVFYKEVVYHSGFIGGLKRIPYRKLLALFPERLVLIIYKYFFITFKFQRILNYFIILDFTRCQKYFT